jgi:hypothetical protein
VVSQHQFDQMGIQITLQQIRQIVFPGAMPVTSIGLSGSPTKCNGLPRDGQTRFHFRTYRCPFNKSSERLPQAMIELVAPVMLGHRSQDDTS